MMRAGSVALAAAVTISTAGCVQKEVQGPDPVAVALAESTRAVSEAWSSVGAVAEAQNPGAIDYLGDYNGMVPDDLAQPISLRWAGPVGGLVERLAEEVGWTYRPVGNKPANDLPVFVDASAKPIAQILRDVGYQAGGRADVIVHTDELVLEVVYAQ